MSSTELVRPEYGTADQRSRVSEIKEGRYTRKVIRDGHGRIVAVEGRTRTDDLADITGHLAERVDGLETELSERIQQLEGWKQVDGMLVNERAISELVNARLGIRIAVKVQFHEPDAGRENRDGWYTYSKETGHVVHVYTDMGEERTAYVIAHEAVHASQNERLGDKFLEAYEHCRDDLEDEARQMAEDACRDLEIVRAA
jgi:regulator of replication initiation timing